MAAPPIQAGRALAARAVALAALAAAPALAVPPGPAQDLRVAAFDPVTGDLTLHWQPGCDAAGHHIELGPLSQVSVHGYTGQVCGLGTSGTLAGFQPGAGSVFFIVVADDGAGIEGSYGVSRIGGVYAERPADTSQAVCSFTRDLSQTCSLPPPPSVGMTAYRPQTDSYGALFQRRAVPDDQETVPGVGVRVNGDDDDLNGIADADEAGIAGENDLVELTLSVSPPQTYGVAVVLERSAPTLRVWADPGKNEGLLVDAESVALAFDGPQRTVWVENPAGGAADLSLSAVAASGGAVLDSEAVHLFPFTSVIIALGGEDQVPGDPVLDPGNHGTFELAIELYELGYDVHMYDEDVVPATGAGAAYDEVVEAVTRRAVTGVVIFGYSHGGGSTNDLARRLDDNRATLGVFDITVTAYTDAIDNDSNFDIGTETALPPSTGYHLNYYENPGCSFFAVCGGPVSGADLNLDVNTTPWGAGLDHFTVDDADEVLQGIRDAILARVPR